MILGVIILLVIIVIFLMVYNMSIHKKIQNFQNINQKITSLNVLQDFMNTISEVTSVDEKIKRMEKGPLVSKSKELPIVPPGANICHLIYGEGRVVAMDVYFPEAKVKDKKIPYLVGIPDEISLYADGKTILHERYGEGIIRAYVVAFQNEIIPLCFPKVFSEGCVKIL